MYGNKNHFYGVQVNSVPSKFCYLLGYTYTGAMYLYKGFLDKERVPEFTLETTTGGHNQLVSSLEWASSGFLVSGSRDQTTRIFGPRNLSSEKRKAQSQDWVELSRAQIHGYDINAVTLLKMPRTDPAKSATSDLLVCAGDEKILRILEPNNFFVNFHNNICEDNLRLFFSEEEQQYENQIIVKENPLTYAIENETGQEALGLMIKAVKTERKNYYFDDSKDKKPEGSHFQHSYKITIPSILLIKDSVNITEWSQPPNEDVLTAKTLWPEVNKLYGHGSELSTCRASPDGTILVSACKSHMKATSALIFWSPMEYK